MLIADPDVALGIKTGGSIIGFITTYAWGYTGEFGATPGALSQSTREQWEMVRGHPMWDTPTYAARQRSKGVFVVASTDRGFGISTVAQTQVFYDKNATSDTAPYLYHWADGRISLVISHDGYVEFIPFKPASPEEVTVVAPRLPSAPVSPTFTPQAVTPPPPFTPEERRALQENFSTGLANSADAALNEGRVPPGKGLGAASIPPPPPSSQPRPQPSIASQTEAFLYRDLKESGYSAAALNRLNKHYEEQFPLLGGNLKELLLKRSAAFATAFGGQWRQGDYLNAILNADAGLLDLAGATIAGETWEQTTRNLVKGILTGGILGAAIGALGGSGAASGVAGDTRGALAPKLESPLPPETSASLPSENLFARPIDASEIDIVFANNLRTGPFLQGPAEGITGSGPKAGSSADIWYHDNLRVIGV